MRKRIKIKKLNRSHNQRKALFKGLVVSLVINEEIMTTKAKAKAVLPIAEKLITKGKKGSIHARRQIQSFIQDKVAVKKIVDDLGVRFKDSPGGYLSITNIGTRRGDNASMVKLSLTKQSVEELKVAKKVTKKVAKKKPVKTVAPKSSSTKKSASIKAQPAMKQSTRKVQNKG